MMQEHCATRIISVNGKITSKLRGCDGCIFSYTCYYSSHVHCCAEAFTEFKSFQRLNFWMRHRRRGGKCKSSNRYCQSKVVNELHLLGGSRRSTTNQAKSHVATLVIGVLTVLLSTLHVRIWNCSAATADTASTLAACIMCDTITLFDVLVSRNCMMWANLSPSSCLILLRSWDVVWSCGSLSLTSRDCNGCGQEAEF